MNLLMLAKAISAQDVIKKSIIKLMPSSIDPIVLITVLTVALLVGIGIFMVYRKYFIGVIYDHSYNISLVIMTVLVAVIIVTISSNIALSLGMVGALSIVRYRTAVKNPLDLMFMFWAITSGIAIGAQFYSVAIISFVFITITFFLMSRIKLDTNTYIMVIKYTDSMETEEKILQEIHRYKYKIRSKVINKGVVEMNVELNLKVENTRVVNMVAAIDGVNDVTMVQYRSSYEL